MEQIGQVVECAHCSGSGNCTCRGCSQKAQVHDNPYKPSIPCSACNGIGKVYLGPQIVQIVKS